jgi:hypothetical protein
MTPAMAFYIRTRRVGQCSRRLAELRRRFVDRFVDHFVDRFVAVDYMPGARATITRAPQIAARAECSTIG